MYTQEAHDIALLVLRLGVGLTLVGHGSRKLLGWFGGKGLDGTAKGFAAIGFRHPQASALAAGLTEAGGGLFLALGLLTPLSGAAVMGSMIVASSVHAPAFFNLDGGFELPALYGLVATVLTIGGPGRFAVDHLLGYPLDQVWLRATLLGIATAAACVVAIRRSGSAQV